MAINSAIIRIRRGPKDDLRIDKLLPGELAMATDAPVMWFCWAPGNVEQVPTSENITEIIAEIIKEYLKDNPVTGISEIYMRVANGYIQYSSDNETWNNLLSIEDITGSDGNDGYSPSVNISKNGKVTTITIIDKNGEHTATINDGADGGDGKDGKTAYQYAQDGGYTGTEAQFSQKLAKEYPSKTSELKNDSGFITKTVMDLANYYLKSETYSQSEINQRLSAIPKFAIQVVTSLPLSGDSATVYLLKSGDAESNLYTEYIYVNGRWEYLGSQSVDLSGYALKTDIPTKLSSLANDAGFITKAVGNLVNYYNKTESDNKYQPKGNYLTEHQDLSGYAKKATTLSGYGITDGATKEQFNQLSQEIDDLKESGTTNESGVVHNAVGSTYPPSQRPAGAEFDGYDIDIYNSMADDVFSYIDAVVSGKDTVTKEILGKDGSGQYDVARYIYANREYIAWQRQNYPKMYAWKNGSNIRYSTSVSPRIGEKLYNKTNVDGGGTIIETITVPSKAAVLVGKRYSLSGGAFKDNAGTSAIVLPLPKEITGDISIKLVNMSKNTNYGHVYGGTVNNAFTETVYTTPSGATTEFTLKNSDYTSENFKAVGNFKFVTFFVDSTGASGQYANSQILVNGTPVAFEITTDPTIATQESTTTTETEVESGGGGVAITAVSATNRSRTAGGVEYIRYENGDIEPTVVYTDKDDERNGSASITKDGITYNRYPLVDLGANKKKLIPIFVYANEHGNPKEINYAPPAGSGNEGMMPAVVASRFLRDLALDKQTTNPFYKFIRENCMMIVIPVANPYGFNYPFTEDNNGYGGYYNVNHVNINRNYDTPGWDTLTESSDIFTKGSTVGSENETQYIMNTMVESGAVVAMSLHGFWGRKGYCLHQGQNPDGAGGYIDYNQEKLAKISEFLEENWGYILDYYDKDSNGETIRLMNTPDVTSKSPSYISQCGAYGGIVEFTEDDVRSSEFKIEHNGYPNENAYAQMLNLMAMWLSDYLEK